MPTEPGLRIGIIGAGNIGGTSHAASPPWVTRSPWPTRGPESLAGLTAETGAKAVSVRDAARGRDVVIVTIPQRNIPDLPAAMFAGVPEDVVVVDTGNYYPRQPTAASTGSRMGSPRAGGSSGSWTGPWSRRSTPSMRSI